jgi:hypothetical protein
MLIFSRWNRILNAKKVSGRKSMITTLTRAMTIVATLLVGCVDPLDPASIDYEDQLIVDGFLTNETKQHQVSIGHVSMINDPTFIPEENASVIIKDDQNNIIGLQETSPGVYKTPYFAGVIGNKYTLSFTTAAGKAYVSAPVEMRNPPAIEKMYATYPARVGGETGVQIFLNSANGNKKTNYYRWEYEDTYEIKTPFPSKFVWLGGNNLTLRLQQVDNCWASTLSKNVYVQSTVGLSQDQVVGFPIKFIPSISQELVIKYSILVKQYALSEQSYFYWKQLRELNEQQGSLYDKQPGNVSGNITPINSNEHVRGFFDASGMTTRRLFLTPKDFAESGFEPALYYSSCVESPPIELPIEKLGEAMSSNALLIYDATGPGPNTVLLLRKACCDCTPLGTSLKPSFWE